MKKIQKLLLPIAFCLLIFPFGNVVHALTGVEDPGQSNPFYKGCTPQTNPSVVYQFTCLTNNILDIVLSITFVAATIAIMLAGIMYMTSAGDATRAGVAKKYLTYSLIGVAVIGGAKLLISLAIYIASLA